MKTHNMITTTLSFNTINAQGVLQNFSSVLGTPLREGNAFIDKQLNDILIMIIYFGLQIPVTAFGIGTNIINIMVFRLSGLKDGVSISFTALSISDLGYCTTFLLLRLIGFLSRVFTLESKIVLKGYLGLSYVISFFSVTFQDISVVITVFVTVQKCCCVSIPYLFKNVFSPTRTKRILTFLCLTMASTYIPIFSGITLTSTSYSPSNNQTIFMFAPTPLLKKAMNFWRIFNKIIFPATVQVITIICLIIMTIKLKKSAGFRTSATQGADNSCQTKGKLGYRERRALSVVVLVAVIYIISTIPATTMSLSLLIASKFLNHPNNLSLRYLLENCQNIPLHVSASINVFVYLKFNTKFKKTAMALFNRCCACAKLDRDENTVPDVDTE